MIDQIFGKFDSEFANLRFGKHPMNRAMRDFLEQVEQEQEKPPIDTERLAESLEAAFRRMMFRRVYGLPDDVEIGVLVTESSDLKLTATFSVFPRPDLRLFSVMLLNEVLVTKGRMIVKGDVLKWRALHGPDVRDFEGDFEGAVRFALMGKAASSRL